MKSAASDLPASFRLWACWRDYLAPLRPRVISLVVSPAPTGMVCAGAPTAPVLAATAIVCIAVGAGAAGALNMWYDADIDRLMRRTAGRPVPSGRVRGADALALGLFLALVSVGLMALAVNLLAAALLAFTIFFYAVVYTMWLKRSTPQNIVIGGLAGALPPAVGWAAASGTVPLNAWLLVAIIFVWTPPHFWSLSLLAKADYERAGVPMMPVIKGEAYTRKQILAYSLVLAVLGVVPAVTGLGDLWYALVAMLAGPVFVSLAPHPPAPPSSPPPKRQFGFSILYPAAPFPALLV